MKYKLYYTDFSFVSRWKPTEKDFTYENCSSIGFIGWVLCDVDNLCLLFSNQVWVFLWPDRDGNVWRWGLLDQILQTANFEPFFSKKWIWTKWDMTGDHVYTLAGWWAVWKFFRPVESIFSVVSKKNELLQKMKFRPKMRISKSYWTKWKHIIRQENLLHYINESYCMTHTND